MTRTGGFQDDDFWTEFHDFLFSGQRYAQAEELLDNSPLLRFPEGARVLDMCCGPGVFAEPLARRGYDVTGVDLSPAMIDRARARAAETGTEVTYHREDARTYAPEKGFDVALNLFTSFGYFEDPADNAQVLRTLHGSLVPGGALVLDLAGKELLARKVTPPKVVRKGRTSWCRRTRCSTTGPGCEATGCSSAATRSRGRPWCGSSTVPSNSAKWRRRRASPTLRSSAGSTAGPTTRTPSG